MGFGILKQNILKSYNNNHCNNFNSKEETRERLGGRLVIHEMKSARPLKTRFEDQMLIEYLVNHKKIFFSKWWMLQVHQSFTEVLTTFKFNPSTNFFAAGNV